MALGIFGTMISNLNQMGFYDFVLPWLFIFAIVYAILKKTNILGNNSANALVSIVVAFFATSYTGISLGAYFTSIFGQSSIFFAAILVFFIFAGLFGFKPDEGTFKNSKWLIIPAAIVILLFLSQNGVLLGFDINSESSAALIMVGVVALAILFVTQEKKEEKPKDK